MNNIDEHLEESMSNVRTIFNEAKSKIDSLLYGEKITATELATQIALMHGMTCAQITPVIKLFVNDKYPGIEIKHGIKGGIYKK